MAYHYIISVSGKGILPADESNRIHDDLMEKLGLVQEVNINSRLTNGFDEKQYTKRQLSSISLETIDKIKKDFADKHRNIEFYLLQKVE